MNNVSTNILSEITTFSKYRKFIPEKNRRETWEETCDRYEEMMIKKFPNLEIEVKQFMIFVREKKILPSMRMLQFAGKPVELNNSRGYNCSYLPIEDCEAFSETMFLLLSGCGVGYSVQKHHITKLPSIKKSLKESDYIIADSIEGWADAIKVLMESYFGVLDYRPIFDFSQVRAKGVRLITSGGKAPGPEPLKQCLINIEQLLISKEDNSKLSSLECHDILCHIANAVLAGGIRRAAMIALFSKDDKEMLNCKSGEWWVYNEQRGRANNSVVLERTTTTKEEFNDIWKQVEASNAGEPGIVFTNNKDLGLNPCAEISLKAFQFCNLTEVNVSDIKNYADLNGRIRAAAFFGTLQATFTDFHYLRPIWKETTEEDRLIGVGLTGIGSGKILNFNLEQIAKVANETNQYYSNILGISPAARVTTIKPSGTTSCVFGSSSGIHAWYSKYYIRRQRIGKNEALYTYLSIYHPELLEDDYFRPEIQAIISIPQKAPEGSIIRDSETAIEFLERVKRFNLEWVRKGHRRGENTNNVSATVSLKPEEWEEVGEWMWENRENYNGISVLPYDSGSYTQAPFEEITEEKYLQMEKYLKDIDLSKVVELDDNTNHTQESSCSGGKCEIV
jgi:ribonucleoside-triphosphate reductase (thioredoxin)